MKAVFKLNFNCGRMGTLEGVFISTTEKVKTLIDSQIQVYFGEVLGKHSEIYGPISSEEITMITSDSNVVKVMEEHYLTSGHNPFNKGAVDFEHDEIDNDEDHTVDELCQMIIDKNNFRRNQSIEY